MKSVSSMSIERLREAFTYCPDSGEIRWRIRPHSNGCAQIGSLAGTPKNGYIKLVLDQVQMRAHRVAWAIHFGRWPEGEIDHINAVRSDNRLANLRELAPEVNVQNRRRANKNSKSGFLGVHWRKDERVWVSQIGVNRRCVVLGRFGSAEEAHAAYVKAKRELHPWGTL